ncbi:MAG: hypothetical protein B6I36_10235 [Desulfobacteraceae bacterium 4572_35.1]|nr:MAG: hypothetical protein B6I36_10235 [Desulfobacteraceae bacterium 4572_35.1]
MNKANKQHSIATLIWLLIFTTTVAVCAVIGQGYKTAADISREKYKVSVELEQTDKEVQQLKVLLAQIRSETLQLFYEADYSGNLGTIIERYPQTITRLIERLDDQRAKQLFARSTRNIEQIIQQADIWAQRRWVINKEYIHGNQRSNVRKLLQRLHSFANIQLGQQRLQEAIDIRRWRVADQTEAQRIANKILKKRGERWFLLLGEIKTEVAQLTQHVEILISTLHGDRLADVRDNMLKPSLEHLERNLFILDKALDMPAADQAIQTLEDLKIALFGNNYHIDQQHQTIVVSGGLYQLCADRLQLDQQRAQLERVLQQRFLAMDNLNTYVAELTQNQYDQFSNQTQQLLTNRLQQIAIGSAIVLLIVIVIGVIISRKVQQQVNNINMLRRHNELILHAAGDGIVGLDKLGRTTFVNPAASKLLGFKAEELLGSCFTPLLPVLHENGKPLTDSEHPVARSLLLGKGETHHSTTTLFQRRDGSCFSAQYISTPLIDDSNNNEGAVLVFKDISEQQQDKKRLQEKKSQLDYLANHDTLTNLPNRRLFRKRLQQAIAYANRTDSSMAVFFIDLDRFKNINDSLGHDIGDKLLTLVAQRLHREIDDCDTIARLGGDEFVIIVEKGSSLDDIKSIAKKLLETVARVFEIDEHRLFISASIGICRYPHDATDATGLMTNADVAMYYAKKQGKNNFQFYTNNMNSRARELQELEIQLRDALKKDQFVLYYQPQVDISNNTMVGVEVLLRWIHPELGIISPQDFIPLAEETGLIVPLGEWVLQTACAQNQQWLQQGVKPVCVAVNISAVQFKNNLQHTVAQILQHTEMDPRLLELEITESMLMDDDDQIISLLDDIKKLGVHFSIDDFGTGYSSLSYLKRLPIDKLKIDRSFISDVTNNDNDAAITTSIIALGHNMNMEIIAEGIELVEQEQFLLEQGCNIGQGYLYAKPMPAEEFVAWLKPLK